MNKRKKLLILCSVICLVTGARASALYEEDSDFGLVLSPSPLANISPGGRMGIEQRFTRKTSCTRFLIMPPKKALVHLNLNLNQIVTSTYEAFSPI